MELGPSPACKFKFRVARCGAANCAKLGCVRSRPVASVARMPPGAAYCAASDGTAVRENGLRVSLSLTRKAHFTSVPVGCTCQCHWEASKGTGPQGPLLARAGIAWHEGTSIEPASGGPPSPESESPKTRLVTPLARPGRQGPEHAHLGVTLSAWTEWPFRYRSRPT